MTRCGAWGGCQLPIGHNMGKLDIPENHRQPNHDVFCTYHDTPVPSWVTIPCQCELIERVRDHIAGKILENHGDGCFDDNYVLRCTHLRDATIAMGIGL